MQQRTRWDEVSWNDLVPRLTLFTVRLLRKRGMDGMVSLAPDLAHTAIERLLSGQRAWNPEKEVDLFRHLTGIVSSLVSHEADLLKRYPMTELDEDGPYEIEDADRNVLENFELEKFLVFARERDPEAHKLAILYTKLGTVTREDQQAILEMDEKQIYNLRRRLKRLIDKYHAPRGN